MHSSPAIALDSAIKPDITPRSHDMLTCLDDWLTGDSAVVKVRHRAGEQMSSLENNFRKGTISRVSALEIGREYLPGELAKAVGVARSSIGSYLSNEQVFPPTSVNNSGRKYDEATARALVVFITLLKPPFGFKRADAYTILTRLNPEKCWEYLKESNKELLLHIVCSGKIDDIINREQ